MSEQTIHLDSRVLVPREPSDKAISLLANFDMDDIGSNRSYAAHECYKALLDVLSEPPMELKFCNPVFHAGVNLTVRRGRKWASQDIAVIDINGFQAVVKISSVTWSFSFLSDENLRDEHDPACRTVAGLLEEMKRVYPGFRPSEEITLVRFQLPLIEAKVMP